MTTLDLGGHGLTCNSLNVKVEQSGHKAAADLGLHKAECFVGPAVMLVGPAGAGVNGAVLPVHARRV